MIYYSKYQLLGRGSFMRTNQNTDVNLSASSYEKIVISAYNEIGTVKGTSRALGISLFKTKRLLINQGAYITDTSTKIFEMNAKGMSFEEIVIATGLNKGTVRLYMPYTKGAYNIHLNEEYYHENAKNIAQKRRMRCIHKRGDSYYVRLCQQDKVYNVGIFRILEDAIAARDAAEAASQDGKLSEFCDFIKYANPEYPGTPHYIKSRAGRTSGIRPNMQSKTNECNIGAYGGYFFVNMTYKGKVYYLGKYKSLDDAKEVRDKARSHKLKGTLDDYYNTVIKPSLCNRSIDSLKKNYAGKKYGMLTITDFIRKTGHTYAVCVCDCGIEKHEVIWKYMQKGKAKKHCGCQTGKRRKSRRSPN